MTEVNEVLMGVAKKYTQGSETEDLSETLEQESRRYSTKLIEEEEARLR